MSGDPTQVRDSLAAYSRPSLKRCAAVSATFWRIEASICAR